jgi:hypothetical protein
MMKRITLLLTVALVVALMLALAGPASATIHPLANSECANAAASEVATGQNPPGISDFEEGNFARPIFAVSGGDPFTEVGEEPPSPAFKTFGPTINELDEPFCPTDE